jgi:hypothetical protein
MGNTNHKRCVDCGHDKGTDTTGRCGFVYVASDPSQIVDTSPTNQCSHYCPRTTGERIVRRHFVFTDYDKPLSQRELGLAEDIDTACNHLCAALLKSATLAHSLAQHGGILEECERIECEAARSAATSEGKD